MRKFYSKKTALKCFSIIKIIINSIDLKAQMTLVSSVFSNPMWTAGRELRVTLTTDGNQDVGNIFDITE